MRRSGCTPALLAALLCGLASKAAAQRYDPAYRWRTADTDHFRIHFHEGEQALADVVAATAERAHAALAPALRYAPPGRTEVVLSDDSDDANGSATPVPYNTIRLYAAPPTELSELNAYRDYVSTLVFHEYTHILHMDNVGGFPAVANRVFGKLWVPNGLVPSWMIEGLAVLHEGDGAPGPGAGRTRSSLTAMVLRSLALEPPGFPALDQASNPPLFWPLGSVPYLLGGRFMEFLEARSGRKALADYLAAQGRQVWPYAPSSVGEDFFGEGFPRLWAEFSQGEMERARQRLEQVRQRPVTHPARLTFLGGTAGWPRWAADGSSIAYLRADLDEHPALVQVTPQGRPVRRPIPVLAASGLGTGGGAAVLSAAEVYREFRLYDDLWRVDLRTGARRRLTRGARASDPALSADGQWLAYLRRTGPGETALVRRRLAEGPEETVFAEEGAQVFAPALSPDGRRVAFAVHRLGRRDIALAEEGRLTFVTADDALDASPAFSPDGKWLLFSSDRGGVYNLYAWPVEECLSGSTACALRQVTNVETGAFQPAVSPDGRTIAFITYSRDGYDLATLPFDPQTWLDPEPEGELAPAPEPHPFPPLASRAYAPWPTLRPSFWFPLVGADAAGPVAGALTTGGDVLGLHSYALSAWWGLRSHQPGYSAAYLGGWSWPAVDVLSSRYVASARVGRRLQTVWTPVDAGLDFPFTHLEWSALFRIGWDGTFREVLGGPGETAHQPEQLGVGNAFGSELTLRAAWSNAERYVRSISPEDGQAAALDAAVAARELGSDYRLAQIHGSVTEYLRLPFTRHVVLAARLGGGAARGSIGDSAPFTLGGPVQPDLLSILLATPLASPDELRGYPVGFLEGTGFALANAELRFPIASPEFGHTTWPIFLRRVHGAVFADLGDAFDLPGNLPFAGHRFAFDQLRLGAGAELRLELALGYFAVTDLRLGAGHAFGRVLHGESSERGVAPVVFHAILGGAF
ncbi:MAG TPA: BamA/TamA family outer membrane protein [Anaeromyxobacter sp.]|nr:BamA/TamA family outer membrane protein [Anaeromyxobacter sp.]